MNDESLLKLSNRMKSNFYVGVVGSVRSGKSTFINSFFKRMILPHINDEFIKNKVLDELPQTAQGRQIMTVEPKFIPQTAIELNINNTIMNISLVDCVGEIIPSSEGYGSENEPRMVKTPWFDEAIPFKEAAQIGTEKVIYNHSNLGIYVTSDGSINSFSREEYEIVENNLIPKLKEINKPFVIVLNCKDPKSSKAINIKNKLEEKWNVSTICLNALDMNKEDCIEVLNSALLEFPISDLEIKIPDYIDVLGDDIPIKNDINNIISDVESKYRKVKDVKNICSYLESFNIFNSVKLELLDASNGEAKVIVDLDDNKYKEIIDYLVGDSIKTKKDFINYLYTSNKAQAVYKEVNNAILEAKETGYGISIPQVTDMELITPKVVKKNGMYGVKLAAKAPVIHMIAVDVESSFTPIIGSEDQSKMLLSSLTENGEEEIWKQEFFGKKLSDIVNDSMKSKIHSFPDKSKDKIKNVLDRIMNTDRSNLIAIIL